MKKLFIFTSLFFLVSCFGGKDTNQATTSTPVENSLESPIKLEEAEDQPNF